MLTSSGLAVHIAKGQASSDRLTHSDARTKVINGITWIEADVIMSTAAMGLRSRYDLLLEQREASSPRTTVRCSVYTFSSTSRAKTLRGEVNLSPVHLQPFKIHYINDLMGIQLRLSARSGSLQNRKSNGVAGHVQLHVEFREMAPSGRSHKVIFQFTFRSTPSSPDRTISSSSRAANRKSKSDTAESDSDDHDSDSDEGLEVQRKGNDNDSRASTFKKQRVNLRSSKQDHDAEDLDSKLKQAWENVQKAKDTETLAKQRLYKLLIDKKRDIETNTKKIQAETEQLRQKEISKKRKREH